MERVYIFIIFLRVNPSIHQDARCEGWKRNALVRGLYYQAVRGRNFTLLGNVAIDAGILIKSSVLPAAGNSAHMERLIRRLKRLIATP